MKQITKREYQVIQLYTKGLMFNEIGSYLGIAERTAINYYMRVKKKDKSRITRAKKSRAFNKINYLEIQKSLILQIEKYNDLMLFSHITKHKVKSLTYEIKELRHQYIKQSLEFAHKSYNKFKLNLVKKRHKKRDEKRHSDRIACTTNIR